MHGTVTAVSSNSVYSFTKPNRPAITLLAGLGVEGDVHAGVTVKAAVPPAARRPRRGGRGAWGVGDDVGGVASPTCQGYAQRPVVWPSAVGEQVYGLSALLWLR